MLPDFVLNIGELEPPFTNILLVFIALRDSPGTSSACPRPVLVGHPTYSPMTTPLDGEVRVKARKSYSFSPIRSRQAQQSYGTR